MLCAGPEQEFPVLYKGRFRPSEAYSRLWLHDLYHSGTIKPKDAPDFKAGSALDFILKLDVLGHQPWDQTRLFSIRSKDLKAIAGLDLKRERFTYQELDQAIYKSPTTSPAIFSYLATYEFLNAYNKPNGNIHLKQFELNNLIPGAWLQFQNSRVSLMTMPENYPWQHIKKGYNFLLDPVQELKQLHKYKKNSDSISSLLGSMRQFENLNGYNFPLEKKFVDYFLQLKSQNLSSKVIAQSLEKNFPLHDRLNSASTLLNVLPSHRQGIWLPLNALLSQVYSPHFNRLVPVDNFTLFTSEEFETIRQNYLAWIDAVLKDHPDSQQIALQNLSGSLNLAYRGLAGRLYTEANGKALYYPTSRQLKAESFYYQYPWIKLLILMYVVSSISLCFAYRMGTPLLSKLSIGLVVLSFAFHTILLFWRSYLLSRPPVSNMFETVIYVPWVTLCGALTLNFFRKNLLVLIAATLASTILLTLIEFTELNQSLDNVQAVLDSGFWLFIHVLLVVGSYGLFILAAILAHFYLGLALFHKQETQTMRLLSESILQSIYLGLAMLIPGTLLGGVWAAESWGRFWDWDPKESWAFISICIYLVWIHAYRYHKIKSFGLAVGAISGLLAISFTWYGVNYILGTGLHSYGFGSGGEITYYAFLLGEFIFLICMLCFHKKNSSTI